MFKPSALKMKNPKLEKKVQGMAAKDPRFMAFCTMIGLTNEVNLPATVKIHKATGNVVLTVRFYRMVTPDVKKKVKWSMRRSSKGEWSNKRRSVRGKWSKRK